MPLFTQYGVMMDQLLNADLWLQKLCEFVFRTLQKPDSKNGTNNSQREENIS